MPGRMDREYFDEKKETALEGLEYVNSIANDVSSLLSYWRY